MSKGRIYYVITVAVLFVIKLHAQTADSKRVGSIDIDKIKDIPKQAKDKVASLTPTKMEVVWEYSAEFDTSSKYCAEVYSIDSSATEYHFYFDSAWRYIGQVVSVYEDSTLVTIHTINNYIMKNCKRSEFIDAEIAKNANADILQVIVTISFKKKHHNFWALTFDGKGVLIKTPEKFTARIVNGIDF
jgi:hypothetical protein